MVKETKKPCTSLEVGRRANGCFAKGNKLSVGNKGSQSPKAAILKNAFLDNIKLKDIRDIVAKLVAMAKEGDVSAAKEVFDRCFGKSVQAHDIDVEVRAYTRLECDNIREMLAVRFVAAESKKVS